MRVLGGAKDPKPHLGLKASGLRACRCLARTQKQTSGRSHSQWKALMCFSRIPGGHLVGGSFWIAVKNLA